MQPGTGHTKPRRWALDLQRSWEPWRADSHSFEQVPSLIWSQELGISSRQVLFATDLNGETNVHFPKQHKIPTNSPYTALGWWARSAEKALAAKLEDLSPIPRIHMKKGQNQLLHAVFWPPEVCTRTCKQPTRFWPPKDNSDLCQVQNKYLYQHQFV